MKTIKTDIKHITFGYRYDFYPYIIAIANANYGTDLFINKYIAVKGAMTLLEARLYKATHKNENIVIIAL